MASWSATRTLPPRQDINQSAMNTKLRITRATELARECMASLGEKESVV